MALDIELAAKVTLEHYAKQAHDLGGWDAEAPPSIIYAYCALAYLFQVT